MEFRKTKKIAYYFLLPIVLSTFLISVAGCGGGGSSSTGLAESNQGQALIGLTDAAGDFVRYAVDVTGLKLHKTDGTLVDALPANGTTTIDFTQLINTTEFLTAATVGAGAYDQVVMTLDYSNADIEVYDSNGNVVQIPVANIKDEAGNPIASTVDVTIQLDSNLLVVGGHLAHMALDFKLDSANVVTFGTDNTPSMTVVPIISADLTPDTTKVQRFRGALQSVDVAGNSFDINVHPFAHAFADDASFGAMTILVDNNTVYNIEGTNYSGSAGLTTLSGEAVDTPVVAHGAFDANLNFTATEVLAGISVQGTLDGASGIVLSRSGDTLTIKGATLKKRSPWSTFFKRTMTVTLASTTKVSKQLSIDNLTKDAISVGQQIDVFGTYSSDTATIDATNGYVRMNLTTISGKLNIPASDTEQANGWVSMSLDRIGEVCVFKAYHDISALRFPGTGSNMSLFDFSGTGIDSAHDAAAADYSIKPAAGLDISSLTVDNMPVKMKGFMKPFGAAPEDFDTQTIMDLSETEAFLNVGWGFAGASESSVFAATPTATTSLVLSGATMGSLGSFHSVNREGNLTDLVKDYPGADVAVETDGASTDKFILAQGETYNRYSTYADFINALNAACDAGANIRRLHAWGTFSDSDLTFSAQRIMIILTSN
jgi:hypothetical protein